MCRDAQLLRAPRVYVTPNNNKTRDTSLNFSSRRAAPTPIIPSPFTRIHRKFYSVVTIYISTARSSGINFRNTTRYGRAQREKERKGTRIFHMATGGRAGDESREMSRSRVPILRPVIRNPRSAFAVSHLSRQVLRFGAFSRSPVSVREKNEFRPKRMFFFSFFHRRK